MIWNRVIAVATLVLCFGANAVAAEKKEAWTKLRPGMTPAEAKIALGEPLIQNHGRGFELWMYDSGAEVVCFLGVVVAWTGPEGARAPEGREIDLRGINFSILPTGQTKSPSREPKVLDYGYDRLMARPFRLPKF